MCALVFFFTVVACFAMLAGHKDTARRVICLHKQCNRNTKATQQTQTMQQKGQHACSKTCIWLSHALANCLCSIAPACRSHGAATSPKWLCSVIRSSHDPHRWKCISHRCPSAHDILKTCRSPVSFACMGNLPYA